MDLEYPGRSDEFRRGILGYAEVGNFIGGVRSRREHLWRKKQYNVVVGVEPNSATCRRKPTARRAGSDLSDDDKLGACLAGGRAS